MTYALLVQEGNRPETTCEVVSDHDIWLCLVMLTPSTVWCS